MLPGKSSRKIDTDPKKKNINKNKRHGNSDNYNNDTINEISLQYSLDKLDVDAYEFGNAPSYLSSDDDKGNDDHDDVCDIYPFASTLEKDIDESEIDVGEETVIHICVYQINTSCELPFLEFLMKNNYDKESNEKKNKRYFSFPSIKYAPSKLSIQQQAKQHLSKLLDDETEVIKYRGHLKDRPSSSEAVNVYLFYHKYFRKLKYPHKLSIADDLWWTVISEIVNFKKVLYIDIDKGVYDFFVRNSGIMRLYDCNGELLETPLICYYGDQYQKITYLAFFGLLKAPLKSSFGPFYVGTNFLSSMKYSCYTYDNAPFELYNGTVLTTGKYGKYLEGGVLRSILFVGKMKVFLKTGVPDDSQISQEVAKTDESVRKLLSLRDSNGNWTEKYDTAYSGLYFVAIDSVDDSHEKKGIAVNTVEWFFKNYNHSSILSYHAIDTSAIPDKYDVDYNAYKIL